MSHVIAVANVKGGVGKTTTTVNLAAAFVERGCKVLAIDLDPQGSLTLSFGYDPDEQSHTVVELLDAKELARGLILPTSEDVQIIPSNQELRGFERELETSPNRIFALKYALKPLRTKYDYILLDCPANAGPLTGAALAAADKVVVPLTPDYLSFQVSRSLFRIVKEIQKRINPGLKLAGIYLTMYDGRTKHARDIMANLHETYGAEMPLFSAVVRQSVRLKEAPAVGKSIIKYEPQSQAAGAYRLIAQEIEEGIGSKLRLPKRPVAAPARSQDKPAVRAARVPTRAPAAAFHATVETPDFQMMPGNAGVSRKRTQDWREVEPEIGSRAPVEQAAIPAVKRAMSTPLAPAATVRKAPRTLAAAYGGRAPIIVAGRRETAASQPPPRPAPQPAPQPVAPRTAEPPVHMAKPDRATEKMMGAQAEAERAAEKERIRPERALQVASATHAGLSGGRDEMQREAGGLIEEATQALQRGDMTKGHSLFRQAIVLNPQDVRAWIGCARTSDNLPERISFAKQALKLDPENPDARDLILLTSTFMRMSVKDRWAGAPSKLASISVGVLMMLIVLVLLIASQLVH